MEEFYNIIVIGAGHAGCEAAAAAANLGSKVLLISMDMTKFAQMSCNPAMGGIAKGQIVREIDALGGYSGIVTDKSSIQFRMLNRSKGPAMWSPRAQSDRVRFSIEWRNLLENTPNLYFWQDSVKQLLIENKKVTGVVTAWGVTFRASAVVITAGTFLNGLMHIGTDQQTGGRIGEKAAYGLTEHLRELGIQSGRMKTGTPPRIDGRTIDFSVMNEQKGDETFSKFSYLPDVKSNLTQRSCFITYTNTTVHEILRTGFSKSPLFTGVIKGVGPRYCPSIEDKIVTFADKDKHQLFLEPEGENCIEYYINGFSSSLPFDVQYSALRKIPGLENCKIFRPAYAIEYDFFQPTQLYHNLESRIIENLFFAGQVNGTTGYEEAAAQGLMAGINAHQKAHNLPEFVLSRDEAYIGVLIDDLITKGVDEPYRMFTSRSEYRILLRQDNADLRLTEKSFKIGLAKQERIDLLNSKLYAIREFIDFLSNTKIKADDANLFLKSVGSSETNQSHKLSGILSRSEVTIANFLPVIKNLNPRINTLNLNDEVLESVEVEIKYSGYIEREKLIADKQKRLENLTIPENFNYSNLQSLSTEARQKLNKQKPKTIGQASRIPGVSPSDINVLLIYLGR